MRAAENVPVIKSRKKILTYDDYAALTPPDSGNYELHNGKIVFMPSPTPRHQDVVTALSAYMRIFAMQHKLGKVYAAPLDTVFTHINTFQPDILFISKAREHIIGEKKIEGAPDLVVEVLSESNIPAEMSYKKYIYESQLVQEYWLINLNKNTVTVYTNKEGELMPVGIFSGEETVSSRVLPGFTTKVSEILNAS